MRHEGRNDRNATLYLGDCREKLPGIGAVDAVVTFPLDKP
jgi:hypothetical protein